MANQGSVLRIDNLTLQIPGLTEEEAARLGEEVADRLANRLPPRYSLTRLGNLNIRLAIPSHTSHDHLADVITDAIVEKLA